MVALPRRTVDLATTKGCARSAGSVWLPSLSTRVCGELASYIHILCAESGVLFCLVCATPQADYASAKAKLALAALQHGERGAMKAALGDVDDFSRWDLDGVDDPEELAGYYRKKLPSCAAGGRSPREGFAGELR